MPVTDTLNAQSPITADKWQGSIFSRFDQSFNISQEKIKKSASQVIEQAVHSAQEDSQTPQMNSMSTTKKNSAESSHTQESVFETKNHNNTVQSEILPLKQADEYQTTPFESVPLAGRLANQLSQSLISKNSLNLKNHITNDKSNSDEDSKSGQFQQDNHPKLKDTVDANSIDSIRQSNKIIESNNKHSVDKMTNKFTPSSKTGS
jgi:hypothetical protein